MHMALRHFHGLLLLTGISLASACSAKEPELHSPDGKIRFAFQLTDSCPIYSIWYADAPMIVASPSSSTNRRMDRTNRVIAHLHR